MNDTPGDDTGQSDISSQDLISDDVASAITSAINGEDGDESSMNGSSTPPTTVKPTKPVQPKSVEEPYNYASHPSSQPEPQPHEEPAQVLPKPQPEPARPPEPTSKPAPPASPQLEITDRGSGNVSELYDIKQSALKQLSPLVEHLEQGPQEKFDTLIMMLRASDDPALIRPAYEAAQAIEVDKDRAQALLDVVNEVNYLTRPSED